MKTIDDWIRDYRVKIDEYRNLPRDIETSKKLGKRYISAINKMLKLITDRPSLNEIEVRLILQAISEWTQELSENEFGVLEPRYQKIIQSYNDPQVMQAYTDIAFGRIREIR